MRFVLAALFLAAIGMLPLLLAEIPGVMVGLLLILFGLALLRRSARSVSSVRGSAEGRASSLPDRGVTP